MTTRELAVQPPAWRTPRPSGLSLADVPTIGGAVAAAFGLAALFGWMDDSNALRLLLPGLRDVKANTAICFALMGTGVLLLSLRAGGSWRRWLGRFLVAAAASIALATLAQDVAKVDFGIDQLFFRDAEVGTIVSGRMSPVTAVCLTLLGFSAIVGGRASRVVIALTGVALAASTLTVLNFIFDAPVPPFLAAYSRMAVSTAFAMGLLSAAVLELLGPKSLFMPLTGRSPTTRVLRGAFALSIAVPLSMIALPLAGQELGIFDSRFGTSFRLLGMMSFGVIATLVAARWLKETAAKHDALEIELDRFFEVSTDMLAVFGADRRFRRVNAAWHLVLGYPEDELIGRSLFELIHPDDLERTTAEADLHFRDGVPVRAFQNRYRARDGSYRWLEWMSKMAPDLSVSFAVARDITARKHKEARRARQKRVLEDQNEALSERAVRDALTGLHNRRYIDDAVARLERRRRRQRDAERPLVAVIIFDLDHFGEINNQYGHHSGDTVLRWFARLLRERFRDEDLVARYGGEEFVAVLEGTTASDAIDIAEDVRTALEATLVDVGSGTPIRVTVSAGCAQLEDGGSISDALAQADVWLSQAKRTGRNQVIGLPLDEPVAESRASRAS